MSPARFEWFCAIDWSGAVGPRQKGIAIAICNVAGGPPVLVKSGAGWAREDILAILQHELRGDTLVGFDFGISLPFADCGSYFPGFHQSPGNARDLWAMVDGLCKDDAFLSASGFVNHPVFSAYFRRQNRDEGPHFRADGAKHGRGRFRVTEKVQALMGCKPYSNFNLVGAAQVGKSSLTGMRMLNRLAGEIAIWPVDPLPDNGNVICEIYTAMAALDAGRSASRTKIRTIEELNEALANLGSAPITGYGKIDDHSSDAVLTAAWLRCVAQSPARWTSELLTREIAETEGWTFGAI
ncbi:hypothetical protein [Altererythrobacter aquiaggeris]|uniref:hypothetical protein n=1 Tax=Aestuarierythrobacter aquiaggeris TaxID=1898396 RepID=UPI00301952A1